MLGSERLDAINDVEGLEVGGLLRPERAVVVEHLDAFRWDNIVRRSGVVTFSTKATMAFFESVLFHDGSGSVAAVPAPVSAIERIKKNNRVFIAEKREEGAPQTRCPCCQIRRLLAAGRLLELLLDLAQIEGAWRLTGG
jgi:hypothetical protein